MTPRQPPAISPEQRAAALAKAGEARRLRAEVKELLKTGTTTLAEVLERAEQEEIVGGLKVEAVLESLPGMGKIKAKRLMETLGVAPKRRLRGLGDRQRAALLDLAG
ncbi:MAG TPA: integration host factor, actinobacterial type [Acidimicrobiia bacterium]|nr:integration host factor, actinobacterial type [Acidimicrobiia bacterium]